MRVAQILQGAKVVPNNADALSELAIKRENCHVTLKRINYKADVNSSITLEGIISTLPKPLRYNWAEIVSQLTLSGHEPSLLNLTTFVSSRARIARSRLGQLANKATRMVETTLTRALEKQEYPVVSSPYAGQGNTSPVTRTHSCHVCSNNHLATERGSLRESKFPQRWEMSKIKGPCFRRLRLGHIAKKLWLS